MISLTEDFEAIAAELKRIQDEKKPVPTPEAAPDLTYVGWLAPYNAGLDGPDYDPA